MKIILAGGGTGGHLYPGVAIAQEFRRQRPDSQILFAITRRKIDHQILSQEGWQYLPIGRQGRHLAKLSAKPCTSDAALVQGFKNGVGGAQAPPYIDSFNKSAPGCLCYHALPVESFQGVSWRTLRALGCLAWSITLALRLVRDFKPSLIIGLGAYPSLPTILAGIWCKIPIVIQEQNLSPGRVNKMLAGWAERVFISFPATEGYLLAGRGASVARERIVLAGNPVRQCVGRQSIPESYSRSAGRAFDQCVGPASSRSGASPAGSAESAQNVRDNLVLAGLKRGCAICRQGRGPGREAILGALDEPSTNRPTRPMDEPKQDLRSLFGLEEGKFTLLIFGGSKGAHRINEAVMDGLSNLFSESILGALDEPSTPIGRQGTTICRQGRQGPQAMAEKLQIIHQTGQEDFEGVQKHYQQIPVKSVVLPFIYRMMETYQLADLVVCRAGATTVAEITLTGKPSIMIPYPYAVGDHQTTNAGELRKAGAAEIILDRDLTGRSLWAMIQDLMEHPGRLALMREESKKLGKPDAASRIVQECIDLILRNSE